MVKRREARYPQVEERNPVVMANLDA